MGRQLLRILARITPVVVLTVVTSRVDAQTIGNGPYYATPSWDQKLQCDTPATCPRFVVLANWSNEAVLDRETGLVWERTPLSGEPGGSQYEQLVALDICRGSIKGGRAGWRLPRHDELASLKDVAPGVSGGLIPAGHPFINVIPSSGVGFYWSADSSAFGVGNAFLVYFSSGDLGAVFQRPKTDAFRVWCVRGPGSGQ